MSYLPIYRLRTLLSGFHRTFLSTHSWVHMSAPNCYLFLPYSRLIQPHSFLSTPLVNNSCNPYRKTRQSSVLFSHSLNKFSTKSEQNANEEKDKKNTDDKEPEFNNSPYLNYGPFLIPISLAIMIFCTVSDQLQAEAPEIDLTTLVHHLERGEIHELNVVYGKVFVRYRPEVQKPLEMVRVYVPVLLNVVRMNEKKWGITLENRVPIYNKVPYELSYDNPAYAGTYTFTCYRICWAISLLFFLLGIKPCMHAVTRYFLNSPKFAQFQDPPSVGPAGFSDNFPFPFNDQNYNPVKSKVRFEDVAGMHACKEEVMEFVSFMKDPKKYQHLGAKLPKGALLLGPPGTGKTLLVKALANEANVPFFTMAGSEFIEIIGGLGARRMRELFKTARENAPSIIFIDEIDSVGARRSVANSDRRNDSDSPRFPSGIDGEVVQTLNQLLVEMDGMGSTENVIVFGATNRADLLDPALLRAGRFDRHIFVDLPNLAERKEIIALYIGNSPLSPSIKPIDLINHLAKSTPGMSGADLCSLCNEAALSAVRRDIKAKYVTQADFETALERIGSGVAKHINPLSPKERRVAAVQEAGRTLIAWLLPRTGLVPIKVSIVPRTASTTTHMASNLGFTQFIPDDRRIYTSEQLNDRMSVLLGGRAAEQVIFNAVSDASQLYLREASNMALKQVREFGMSKVLGNLSFQEDSGSLKPYSQLTQRLIESEAQRIVSSAYNQCINLLNDNKNQLENLVNALVEKEVLTYDELVDMFKNASFKNTAHDPAV